MATRYFIAVLIALQALAGCGMPTKAGVTRDEHSAWRKTESAVLDARLRRQVEAGTFGLAQLYPGRPPIDPRQLRPLPRLSAVAVRSVPVALASPSESPVRVAFGVAQPDPCVYKPTMSDADINACR